MEVVNKYIIILVSTLVLMTAVELIAPDNNMKKYLKFVLGLILISVMLTPIMDFVNNGEVAITSLIEDYENEYKNLDELKSSKEYESTKVDSFTKKLNLNCKKILEEKFKDISFTCESKCGVDYEKMTYTISEISIKVKNSKVQKVEKIEIGTEKINNNEDELLKEIKKYLSEELEISESKIAVNYSNGG